MPRLSLMRRIVAPAVLLGLIACANVGQSAKARANSPAAAASRLHAAAGPHGAAVRAAFNADAGKVRVLILGDPT